LSFNYYLLSIKKIKIYWWLKTVTSASKDTRQILYKCRESYGKKTKKKIKKRYLK